MNRRNFIQSIATTAALPLAAHAHLNLAEGTDSTQPRRPSQAWFSRDGLGLFICFGISSLGNIEIGWGLFEDVGKPNPYWPPEKYYALADRFDPQNYDPDRWMEAAARAGFKYCVYLARHCDGYALWPSEFGDFSTKQTMHGRDLVRPYVEACRKHGLKVGFYYSPTDWHYNPQGWPHQAFPRRDAEMHHSSPQKLGIPKFVDMPIAEMQKYFEQFYAYVKGQVGELLTRYGVIDLWWWDGYDWPEGIDIHGEDMDRYVRQLQPHIVQNDRYCHWTSPKRMFGDYDTHFEARDPANRPEGAWEQCEQVCVGWSWRGENAPCRPTSHLLERLARDRAWGGNYLPDFGPRPDGTMAPTYYAICDEMAAWMKHNSVSVFDVEAGPYPERSDAPVTIKGNVWYVHFLSHQHPTATLTGVHSPKAAKLLRTGQTVAWKEDGDRVVLTLPAESPSDLDEVVEVTW
ncbi:MAG: alpha-L-fucosidase [Terriglobia bacterium]|jgi:alpha-L-fucosidase